jgi:hypothetical protein
MASGRRAWGFNSDLTLEEMKDRLKLFSSKPWIDRDSDVKPDSIYGELSEESAVRIFSVGEDAMWFVAVLMVDADDTVAKQVATDALKNLMERVLPAVEARDIKPTDLP